MAFSRGFQIRIAWVHFICQSHEYGHSFLIPFFILKTLVCVRVLILAGQMLRIAPAHNGSSRPHIKNIYIFFMRFQDFFLLLLIDFIKINPSILKS